MSQKSAEKALRILSIIPARFASERLPGKPLKEISGKPMIQWVYERVSELKNPSSGGSVPCIVATDDERILQAVEGFGGKAMLTSPDHQSGTDRMAEVAEQNPADIYINVQGDEPLIQASWLERALKMVVEKSFDIGTLSVFLRSPEDMQKPSVVKVITSPDGQALHFFRTPQSAAGQKASEEVAPAEIQKARQHVGVYVYRREALEKFRSCSQTELEKAEKLEQLRAMQNGISMGVAPLGSGAQLIGVDTLEDLEKVRQHLV